MVIFDSRKLSQDTPLVFFTASTFMFWTIFRNSSSPFSLIWWIWMLATGISMTGAMATRLVGAASVGVIGIFTGSSIVSLAMDRNICASTWSKHFLARMVALVVIPTILYIQIFQYHFDHQKFLPKNPSIPRANYDLGLLSKPYRQTLLPKTQKRLRGSEINWRDIVYGSVVQIQNEETGSYIHSINQNTPGKSKQQQLGGYEHSDVNTHWIVIRADMEEGDKEEIPSRLQYLKDGDIIRFRHVPTRLCLHSHNTKSYSSKDKVKLYEVTAYGAHGFDGDENDWWVVEAVDPVLNKNIPIEGEGAIVKAMATTFRLRHYRLGCYLLDTSNLLPRSWGKGRRELACRGSSKVRSPSIWRFSMNRHEYLPHDVPAASYPKLTYWQKFSEIHRLMWSRQPNQPDQPEAVHPILWPLGQTMIHLWTGYTRQMFMIANPVIWGVGIMGVLSYLGLKVLFILREKRGYVERRVIADFKEFHMNSSNIYFLGWATHYLPFLLSQKSLEMHHYLPALYFSILTTSSMIAGASSFLPRTARFSLFVGLICITICVFSKIAPLTNGSTMTNEQCLSLSQWVNPLEKSESVAKDLHCELFPLASSRRLLFPELQKKRQMRQSLNKANSGSKTSTTRLPKETKNDNNNGNSNNDINNDKESEDPLLDGQQPNLILPESMKKPAPVLPLMLPLMDYPLPMDHLVMVGPQLPPQHRDTELA
ncbi:hypothetical protein BGZ76_008826 [Entomortierella beljakovae]|nr:hypothetical protein BGZ76_008826 [Entomortierella beljakovae]